MDGAALTFDAVDLPWRAPMQADCRGLLKALSREIENLERGPDGTERLMAVAAEVRRLANQRLGPLEEVALGRLTARLWPHRERLPLRTFRIAVLGNRNLDFLIAHLRGAGLARGLLIDVAAGGYDRLAAIATGGAAAPWEGQLDAAVIVLDEQGFASLSSADERTEAERLASLDDRLRDLARGLRDRARAPVVVATLTLPPEARIASADGATPGARARLVSRANDAIFEGAARGDWVVWDLAALAAEVGLHRWFDPVRFALAKAPFAVELSALVADHLCRTLAAMAGKSGRVLVMDLDNTLWGGVIGDDGPEGIRLGQGSPEGEAYLAVQRLALDLRRRGVLLAVASKNDEAIARQPFIDHPEMLLRESHIAVFQANWSDKATNLQAIAVALGLGLDALVFVDDNPAERARVRQMLPEVCVPELGEDPAWYPRLIVASGAFDHLVLNAEDRARAESYGANAQRAALLSRVGAYDEYLRSLGMTLHVAPFDRMGRARIAQLINKSNQFNLTSQRYNEAQVEALESDEAAITCQARLTDAFGDHGMIGVVIVRTDQGAYWTIDTWLMSCRVLERGVEQALMNQVVALAKRAGISHLRGTYRRTPRNGMVADFYDRMGFERLPDGAEGRADYILEVARFNPFIVFLETSGRVELRFGPQAPVEALPERAGAGV